MSRIPADCRDLHRHHPRRHNRQRRSPHPPAPGGHEKAPKVPTIFLGVETSQVPTVVSEQLGLSKGLGLVVEYVVPNSPAADGRHSTERYSQNAERPDSDRTESIAKAPADVL